ncbi:MAG TPA: 4Fe-4S dicluster domain-containing protein [Terracidiphilus sp.]|jgi:NAD-dependent dihydropyrimidine dehydrogenase PreA subunit
MFETKMDRGLIRVDGAECKGCGLCLEACPPKLISLSERLNHYGYRTATYAGSGCTGCGICFLVCPEPGAITVLRLAKSEMIQSRGADGGGKEAVACASN